MKLKTVQTTCLLGIKQAKWKRNKEQHPKNSDSRYVQALASIRSGGKLGQAIINSIRRCAEARSWPQGEVNVHPKGWRAGDPYAVWERDAHMIHIRIETLLPIMVTAYMTYAPWCWTFVESVRDALEAAAGRLEAQYA